MFVILLTFLGYSPASQTANQPVLAAIVQRLQTGQPTRIVCFGDSITGVYYHTGGERAWCEMLGCSLQKLYPNANLEMINSGSSGHTTVNALARIEKDVLAHKPDLVVVMFGMNDVTRVSREDFEANTQTIVQRCREIGSQVILCTPNSVYDNPDRPNAKLDEYSQSVRELASKMAVPMVDVFADWQQARQQEPTAWMLLMSDTIHPNMNGHKRFAQLIAKTICDKEVTLDDLPVPANTLFHTFDLLHAGKPVHVIAMPPLDGSLPGLLSQHFPAANIRVTPWPVQGKTLHELAEWAKQIRGMNPDLVAVAVPGEIPTGNVASFIDDYEWVLNWSFQFAGRPWDVFAVMPPAAENAELRQYHDMARQIIVGKDIEPVEKRATDDRSQTEVVAAWIAEQYRAWRGARALLPATDDHVLVPVQSWPHQPGPRSVKVSLQYPGGSIDNVNSQTGIMLTLHNWGGVDCVGTADPRTLADRLNVIAVCVNYLQSGKQASIDDPQPYDFGYLQALDSLNTLAYVRQGLEKAERPYNDARLFCTGGSGGGNVTLMATKLAPRTFAGVIDMCGMAKLSDDIAFDLPGGSKLNARYKRDVESASYLSVDAQELRFVGNPIHLAKMKELGCATKIVVVHGVDDTTCPVTDAREMVENMRAAGLDVEPHFIDKKRIDGKVFTSTGHALGNRTEIVLQVAKDFLEADAPLADPNTPSNDFEHKEEVRYDTSNGQFIVSYKDGSPLGKFVPSTKQDVGPTKE